MVFKIREVRFNKIIASHCYDQLMGITQPGVFRERVTTKA